MTALLEDPSVLAVLQIAEPNTAKGAGAVHDYALRADRPTPDGPAYRLRHLKTGKEYRVSRWRGKWACNCPHYRFVDAPQGRECKHLPPVRERFARLAAALKAFCERSKQ
jgi:hypothetical protein